MRVAFVASGNAETVFAEDHRRFCRGRGIPGLGKAEKRHLMVVGGGQSAVTELETIRCFGGDIWAINGAWEWLQERGIASWFYTVDPRPFIARYITKQGDRDPRPFKKPLVPSGTKAILASSCHPSLFRALEGADIEAFDVGGDGFKAGPTSACQACAPALARGYKTVTFVGCDSAFVAGGRTHVYGSGEDPLDLRMIARCGKQDYETTPQWALQAEFLAEMIRAAPTVFREISGSFLRALVRTPDWEVIAGTPALAEVIGLDVAPRTLERLA